MGSTGLMFEALKRGAIDVYPDYGGTLSETLLKNPNLRSLGEIRQGLAPLGLTISDSLGFNNTYALAVPEEFARKHGLQTMSDLRKISAPLRAGFSYEFMDRSDGYPGMVARYGFAFDPAHVKRMEHSLVYQAVQDGALDLIEVYSTDANIPKFHLRVLADDLGYFPRYEAVWVARQDFVDHHPEAWRRLRGLEGKIGPAKMIALNAQADIDKKSYAAVAAGFLGVQAPQGMSVASEILARTREHLLLVGIALLFSVLVGIPLGIASVRYDLAGQSILLLSSLVQTVPTLALLCFLIPVFGVGLKPALVALCLYSLLPVVLNTYTSVKGVDPRHVENAKALGLSRAQILTQIVLPLASPTILAGVKTAAIVSIGTATLAALIGAGGYGALIVTGLSLNDTRTILMGAVPAAGMALVVHFGFELARFWVVPRGIRRGLAGSGV
jgi:osmoprotectant transport system permease protein